MLPRRPLALVGHLGSHKAGNGITRLLIKLRQPLGLLSLGLEPLSGCLPSFDLGDSSSISRDDSRVSSLIASSRSSTVRCAGASSGLVRLSLTSIAYQAVATAEIAVATAVPITATL